jgi:hypothetical protein
VVRFAEGAGDASVLLSVQTGSGLTLPSVEWLQGESFPGNEITAA